MDRLLAASLDAHGQVDLVCLNAGVAVAGSCWELPLEAWRWVIEVNLFGVVNGIRTFVPHLIAQGHGHVVNTASIAGLIAAPGLGPYAASKHAVVSVSESLALDLEQAGSPVGVSVLCPAFVRTRLHESTRVGPEGLDDVLRAPGSGLHDAQDLLGLLIETGFDVEIVTDAVVDAVRTGRFYVLTHPGTPDWVRGRAQRVHDDGRPGMPDLG
jgi:NAD(P)-dependent dehydrogenase (short-subunit alcohol dehydrogenase family)